MKSNAHPGRRRSAAPHRGVAETGTPEIVAAAGVTRGALYHHFADKADLFRAVCAREADAIGKMIVSATQGIADPEEALLAGTRAYFDAVARTGRTRLLLLDAPAVLGHAEAVALVRSDGVSELREGLARIAPDMDEDELQALADMLSAAFDRAALAIEEGRDRSVYERAMRRLVSTAAR